MVDDTHIKVRPLSHKSFTEIEIYICVMRVFVCAVAPNNDDRHDGNGVCCVCVCVALWCLCHRIRISASLFVLASTTTLHICYFLTTNIFSLSYVCVCNAEEWMNQNVAKIILHILSPHGRCIYGVEHIHHWSYAWFCYFLASCLLCKDRTHPTDIECYTAATGQ